MSAAIPLVTTGLSLALMMQKGGCAIVYRHGVTSSQSRYISILQKILVSRACSLVHLSLMVQKLLTVIASKPYEKTLLPPPRERSFAE